MFNKKEKIIQILFSSETEKSDQQFMVLTNKGRMFRMSDGEWTDIEPPYKYGL